MRSIAAPSTALFGAAGGSCAALQLVVLAALVRLGLDKHLANIVAFFASTQVNVVLSSAITWRERRGREALPGLPARLVSYNLVALGVLVVNQLVFALAATAAHYLVASALGILAGMVINYAVSRGAIFRQG